MHVRSRLLSVSAIGVAGMLFLHCAESGPSPVGTPPDASQPAATLRLLMTDAPVDASAVYVNVVETNVRFEPAAEPTPSPTPESGTATPAPVSPLSSSRRLATGVSEEPEDEGEGMWITVSSEPATYDLLTLQDGVTAVLGEAELEAGTVSQIRLVLDSLNPGSIVVEGETYPLVVPSGSESGLKLNGDIPLAAGLTTSVVIDFDAEKSIIQTGNGEYKLKPVLSVSSVTTEETVVAQPE